MDFRKILWITPIAFFSIVIVHATGSVCHHCEDIREYNAKFHQNFEYYEDYLKSQSGEKKGTIAENEPKNTKILGDETTSDTDQAQRKHAKNLL
jgi:hypothetical protein